MKWLKEKNRWVGLLVILMVLWWAHSRSKPVNTEKDTKDKTTASAPDSAEKSAPVAPAPVPAPAPKPKEPESSVVEEPAKPVKVAEEKPIVYVFIQVVADSNKQANNAVAVKRLPNKLDDNTDNELIDSPAPAKAEGDPATEKLLQELEKVRKELQEKSKQLSKAKSKLVTAAKFAHRNHDRQVAQFVVQLKDTIEQLKTAVEELRSKSEALLEKLNET